LITLIQKKKNLELTNVLSRGRANWRTGKKGGERRLRKKTLIFALGAGAKKVCFEKVRPAKSRGNLD